LLYEDGQLQWQFHHQTSSGCWRVEPITKSYKEFGPWETLLKKKCI
jgi:hypothetical protein